MRRTGDWWDISGEIFMHGGFGVGAEDRFLDRYRYCVCACTDIVTEVGICMCGFNCELYISIEGRCGGDFVFKVV